MKWTLAQQRKYRAQVKELGLDDEARRALLRTITGKGSTSELDSEQLARVIREQERRLGHSATQDDMIHGLEKVLGWYGQPARLNGFIRRQTRGRKHELRQLTRREKSALIEALKGVHAHTRERIGRTRRRRRRNSESRGGNRGGGLSCAAPARMRQERIHF